MRLVKTHSTKVKLSSPSKGQYFAMDIDSIRFNVRDASKDDGITDLLYKARWIGKDGVTSSSIAYTCYCLTRSRILLLE